MKRSGASTKRSRVSSRIRSSTRGFAGAYTLEFRKSTTPRSSGGSGGAATAADVGVTSSTSLSDKQRIKHLELENTLLKQEQAALEKLRAENSRLQELNAAGRIKELEEELEEVTSELLEMQQSKESTIQDLEKKLEAMLQKDGESAAALLAANDELADMRERLDNNDLEKENKIYDLQRMINISSQSSKEHVNALSIAAKKLVKFEDRTKVYKQTSIDISQSLGDALSSLCPPMRATREDIEVMQAAAQRATPNAPDATYARTLTEKSVAVMQELDSELQLALNDVPEEVRDLLGEMNGFADVLSKNHGQSERVNADVTRILDTLEGACRSFQGEIQSLPLVETD